MEIGFKSIRALFKGKINPILMSNKLKKNKISPLPFCYTIEDKNIHNFSFNKNRIKHFIRNRDLSKNSNYLTKTNDDFKNKRLLNKKNLTLKKPKINKMRILTENKKLVKNYSNLSDNTLSTSLLKSKSIRQLSNKKTINNISYIKRATKTNKLINGKNNLKDKNKIILVKKNQRLLNKLNNNKSNDKKGKFNNNSLMNEFCKQNKFHKNESNNKCDKNIKNIFPYQKKNIVNKQLLDIGISFMNETQNLISHPQYTSEIYNLEINNILPQKRNNFINKNKSFNNINNYKYNTINQFSMDKENINKVNLNDNIYPEKSIGVDTEHYRIKNININFNNIKVVNNISKKCATTSIENENEKFIRINTAKKKLDSCQNEKETLKPLQNNKIESDYMRKEIKVSKTKSLLKFPKESKNSAHNIKVMKAIIKGKSENHLKVRKKIRIMKIDSCTIEGKSFKQKYNQENFFMKEKFLNKNEEFLIGICDGHGKHGKLISKYIVNLLPKLISSTSENEIVNSYLQMNKHIISENNKKFDCSLSGVSCISLIISLEKIISINLGDSKAVLARQENGLYNYVNLNRQHKPTEPDEKERILENNGEIRSLYENNKDKKIIFLKNSDIPGLEISRSFGDIIAHSVGVISEPEVKSFYFNGKEKFVILASNEYWEIIDAEESVKIVKEFYENDMDAIGALNKIANELLKKCENQQNSINDDITIIIVFFE